MMLERDDLVQTQAIAALSAAMGSVPVMVEARPPASGRYVRVDAFSSLDDDLYKTAETTTHSFTVHVFDAPPGGTSSLKWTRQTLALADNVVRAATLAGGKARRQDSQVLFEPRTAEGVFDAHGFIRYSVQIGA